MCSHRGELEYYDTAERCIMEAPAKCPNCGRNILEKTLVEPA